MDVWRLAHVWVRLNMYAWVAHMDCYVEIKTKILIKINVKWDMNDTLHYKRQSNPWPINGWLTYDLWQINYYELLSFFATFLNCFLTAVLCQFCGQGHAWPTKRQWVAFGSILQCTERRRFKRRLCCIFAPPRWNILVSGLQRRCSDLTKWDSTGMIVPVKASTVTWTRCILGDST